MTKKNTIATSGYLNKPLRSQQGVKEALKANALRVADLAHERWIDHLINERKINHDD